MLYLFFENSTISVNPLPSLHQREGITLSLNSIHDRLSDDINKAFDKMVEMNDVTSIHKMSDAGSEVSIQSKIQHDRW